MIRSAGRTLAQSGGGEDRIKIIQFDSKTIAAALADGAGGSSAGGRAAGYAVENLTQKHLTDYGELFDTILKLDHHLKVDPFAGLSTIVSIYTNELNFIGAVVGDSDALLIRDGMVSNLAPNKELQPLLGDGEAFPSVFSGSIENSVLILCSDGLSKYISSSDTLKICSENDDPSDIVDKLINAVVLSNGLLQDDVSVVVLSE